MSNDENLPTGSSRKNDGTLHGWTGRKCTACNGSGEAYHAARDCDGPCPSCGGTGDEYDRIPEPAALVR